MPLTRRDVLISSTFPLIKPVLHNLNLDGNDNGYISIIGASGETGKECIRILTEEGRRVNAISRKPFELFDDIDIDKKLVKSVSLDIKDRKGADSLDDVLKGSSAVLFLANAKRKYKYIKTDVEEFQNYEDIDVYAMQNIVKGCIKHRVPRLVYVSGSCRSCLADNRVDYDKICGLECEHCIAKQIGENIIRKEYSIVPKKTDYTIIRTGYLFNGVNRGVSEIELNQDYTKSGMISRVDLANLCIRSLENDKTSRTTFEAYYRDSTQPYDVKESLSKCTALGKSVEECFFGSSFKDRKPDNIEDVRKNPIKGSIFTTGEEYSGGSWEELFGSLKKDNIDLEKMLQEFKDANID
ncbi:NAD(P)-dependent oxidoreductase [Flavobacterium sp.]|uniref:NAD(P)-dependent oxidoreductase n=1 Tax=Flavobacterium sp. TaxID=239 RepID=UPI0037C0E51E